MQVLVLINAISVWQCFFLWFEDFFFVCCFTAPPTRVFGYRAVKQFFFKISFLNLHGPHLSSLKIKFTRKNVQEVLQNCKLIHKKLFRDATTRKGENAKSRRRKREIEKAKSRKRKHEIEKSISLPLFAFLRFFAFSISRLRVFTFLISPSRFLDFPLSCF